MGKDKKQNKGVVDRAFSDLADEFRENAEGAGASLGRSAKFLAGTVEVVVTSPLLIPKGYKAIVEKMKPRLDKEIQKIPKDKLVEPDLSVAGPALEAMRFTIEDDVIADLFAKLLASSMHSDLKSKAHHSFVEVIKQLSPGEARILKFLKDDGSAPLVDLRATEKKSFGYNNRIRNGSLIGTSCGIDDPALVQIYIDNLCRLGLCEIPSGIALTRDEIYEPIEQSEEMKAIVREIEDQGREAEFKRKVIGLTDFGIAFCSICMTNE